MNTIGEMLRLTTFGESHGPAMGGILDGMPSGVKIDMKAVQMMIDRRRTGRNALTSQRKETDVPEILSGVSAECLTLGTPIGFIFRNSDARSGDYSEIESRYRPNHADFTYDVKYGLRDARGGGRSSARETVNWVMGGAIAMEWLKTLDISIHAKLTGVGNVAYDDPFAAIRETPWEHTLKEDPEIDEAMLREVENAKNNNDSVGGRVSCVIFGAFKGLGEPVFGKAQARLAAAMMSINAAKAFEYGLGVRASESLGSQSLDLFSEYFGEFGRHAKDGRPIPMLTNRAGGMLGGITTGMPIYFNVHFKPTPTLSRPLPMPDCGGEIKEVTVKGRHDPCVAMRAPVIVEALAALTIADLIMLTSGRSRL